MSKKSQSLPNTQLLEARLSRRWSQRELAGKIATSFVNISRWERGITLPGSYYRHQLCSVFGMSAQELGLAQGDTDEHCAEASSQETQHQLTPSSSSEAFPSLWNIPFRRNLFFTGREEVLEHLHDILHKEKDTAVAVPQALSGLGGIGKTQIAIEYAYRYRNAYQTILWARAETRDLLMADFASIAEFLELLQQGEQDHDLIVKAVKQWLENYSDWLLILDNVQDFSLLVDLLPYKSHGYVLLTTQLQATGTMANSITVKQLEPDEGALFLLRRGKLAARDVAFEEIPESLRVQARALSELLDGLPLALDQAGAHIEETGCSLSDYQTCYQVQQDALLQRRGTLPTDHPHSVTSTFALIFKQVQQKNAAAISLLTCCSFLAPEDIPLELFSQSAMYKGTVLERMEAEPLLLDQMLETLRTFSLVHREREQHTLSMHRLVQTVLRAQLCQDEQRQWAERVICAVNQVFPDVKDPQNWTRCKRYMPHARACAVLIDQYHIQSPAAARLLHHVEAHLTQLEQYTQDVATSRQHMAGLYAEQNQYEQTEQFYERAPCIHENASELNHSRTAESLNDPAKRLEKQGLYDQAETLYLHALAMQEQKLGAEHIILARVLASYANLLHLMGREEEAVAQETRVEAIRQKS